MLQLRLTEGQRRVIEELMTHRRLCVRAGHAVGKTLVAAALVNWFYDSFDPGVVITTAPTKQQVTDVLWKEIRAQRVPACRRRGVPNDLLKKSPRMESSPNHVAMGLTTTTTEAFQGRHEESILIVFDEAVGVDGLFWDGAKGMMTSPNAYWLNIYNPTDVTSTAYLEERRGQFRTEVLSVLEHPNIAIEQEGGEPPFPAAVRLRWVLESLEEWTERLAPGEEDVNRDVEFPAGSGFWYRPGPEFESRVLGRWPSTSQDSVWSEALWDRVCTALPDDEGPFAIGCDVARYGGDRTVIVVRQGRTALHHETHRGWSTVQTAGRLRELVAERYPGARILVDDDGVGGGVVDLLADLNVVPIRSGSRAGETGRYPNLRSELWFRAAERARAGGMDLSRLDRDAKELLRNQLCAARWRLDAMGRRVVESKDETRKRLQRSPDDADALNLAFYEPAETGAGWVFDHDVKDFLMARLKGDSD